MKSLNKHNNEHSIFKSVQKFGKKLKNGPGVLDIQVNSANNNEAYIPKQEKICYAEFVEFVQRGHIISMFDHSSQEEMIHN